MTKVTVLMAVYNSEAFLKESIDSLLGQTMKEIQVVCVDDASTDGEQDIIKDYLTQHFDMDNGDEWETEYERALYLTNYKLEKSEGFTIIKLVDIIE